MIFLSHIHIFVLSPKVIILEGTNKWNRYSLFFQLPHLSSICPYPSLVNSSLSFFLQTAELFLFFFYFFFTFALNHLSTFSVICLFYPCPNSNTVAIRILLFHPFPPLLALAHTLLCCSCSFHKPLFELPLVSVSLPSLLLCLCSCWVSGGSVFCMPPQ